MWIYETIVLLCYLTVQGEEDCDPGKYGDVCSQNCSQNCKPLASNIVFCHKETGFCFEGCTPGVYGNLCNEPCSTNCLRHICNQHNGHCTQGCIDNHIGDFCEVSQEITTVHQGTTHSSHTTVATGVAPTSSSQVVIPDVVTVLVLVLVLICILILIIVGAVIIFIWNRKKEEKKKKMKKKSDPEDQQTFLPGSLQDGQDKQDLDLGEEKNMKEIQEMKDMLRSMQKMMSGSPPSPESSGLYELSYPDVNDEQFSKTEGPVSETQIESGRRETLCGSNQGDGASSEMIALISGSSQKSDVHATIREEDTRQSGTPSRPDTGATPTPARRDTRTDADLQDACLKGNRAEVKRILDTGQADVNIRGLFGMTPVIAAAGRGHRGVVEFLVSQGADVSMVDDDGDNILHCACLGGDRNTVEFVLFLGGLDINSRGWRSRTPVMAAAQLGHRGVVEFLVSQGADVSLMTDGDNNILHWACVGGDRETVKSVLSLDGVDINSRGGRSRTPVMVAAQWRRRGVVEFLVSQGADVSLVDDDGDNILHWACMGGDRNTVEFVLSLVGVDINSRGGRSRTPVMAAAQLGHRGMVEFLVSQGADVSLVDDGDNNILHYACVRGDRKTVKFVLSLGGADVKARNNYEQTAADVARHKGHTNVVELLESSGCHVV